MVEPGYFDQSEERKIQWSYSISSSLAVQQKTQIFQINYGGKKYPLVVPRIILILS